MSVQERRIVNEAEEEAKKNRKKILGIFPRREANRSGSGTNTPAEPKPSKQKAYDADDDLPPREEADLGSMAPSTFEQDLDPKAKEEAERERIAMEEARKAEEKAMNAIPKTAGFDFSAISKELGKEIDMEKLNQPEKRVEPVVSPLPSYIQPLLERSGSAPPAVNEQSSSTISRNAASWGSEEDDEGDITFATNQARQLSLTDVPSWDRPVLKTTSSSSSSESTERKFLPPVTTSKSAFSFGFNAWSAPEPIPTPTSGLMRNAPPARSHPAELMANPFASSPTTSFNEKNVLGGKAWKKEEEMATNNPW